MAAPSRLGLHPQGRGGGGADCRRCDPSREIPLVIQDKIFDTNGDLWYPSTYDQQFFAYLPPAGAPPLPSPSTGAEFWGDTILVNGTAYPYAEVEPRRYRLRILNACNTRFLSVRLIYAQGLYKRFVVNSSASRAVPTSHEPIRQRLAPYAAKEVQS